MYFYNYLIQTCYKTCYNACFFILDSLLRVLSSKKLKSTASAVLFGRIIPHVPSIDTLGANLGMMPAELEQCVQESPQSLSAQVYCMLLKWKENEGSKATVKNLLKAMQYSTIPEELYRDAVLDYFDDSDSD